MIQVSTAPLWACLGPGLFPCAHRTSRTHKRRRGVATKLRRLPGTPREALILLGVVRVEWALPNAADMIPPAAADDGRAQLGEWALLRHRRETGHILTEIQS